MSTKTSIEWTDVTWNPIRGCSLVSAGCTNCYAMKQAHRFSGKGKPYEGLTEIGPQGPRWTGKIMLVPEVLEEPLHWKQPRRVFVNSMSDLFHEDVPDEFIEKVLTVMSLTPQHTYQVLTKRPQRMRQFFAQEEGGLLDRLNNHAPAFMDWDDMPDVDDFGGWPMHHLWLGVSVEDQATADERIPVLMQTPAALRWVSAEPLLGPISFRWAKWDDWKDVNGGRRHSVNQYDGLRMLDWLVVGGESGPGARPCSLMWIRSIKDQCQAAKVPVFVKQLGALWYDHYAGRGIRGSVCIPADGSLPWEWVKQEDRKGGDIQQWPEDLQLREFPNVRLGGD